MKKNRYLLLLSAFAPIALFLAYLSGGAGHGNYLMTKLLFPMPMALAILFGEIFIPIIFLAVIQFPLYGYILDRKNCILTYGLLVAHIVFAVGAISFSGNF